MKKLIFLLFIVNPMSAWAQILKGTAKNLKGEVVYIEKHEITLDESGYNKFIRVQYNKPDGSLMATMTSDFSKNKNIPETVFEDKRFNTKLFLKILDSSIEIEEIKENKSISKKKFDLHETMVASQGFDNFIRFNSVKLKQNPIEFKFGVLEKKDFFSLTGYQAASSAAEDKIYGIQSSSWFLRIFVKELKVVYDAKTMRLKSFSGRSNILDDSGSSQDVVIDYQWMDKS